MSYLAVLELLRGMLICTCKNLLKYVLANDREFIFTTASISIIWVRVLYKMPANCLFAVWYFQLFILSVTLIVRCWIHFPEVDKYILRKRGKIWRQLYSIFLSRCCYVIDIGPKGKLQKFVHLNNALWETKMFPMSSRYNPNYIIYVETWFSQITI